MDIGLPSLYDVWRLALPAATTLCNKQGDLEQNISWAHRMSALAPAFGPLDDNDLVLISVSHIQILDDRLTLSKIIESLSSRGISALAVLGEVTSEAIKVAKQHKMCILSLPGETDLRDVERDVVRLIVEREAQLDRRGKQIYRQLAQHSLENRGLNVIARSLKDIVKKTVVVQDENQLIQALELTVTCPFTGDEIDNFFTDRSILDRWLVKQHLDSRAPPSANFEIPGSGWERCVTAIVIEGRLVGYLSVLGPKNTLDDLDRLAVERGSLVCAVEMAKQRAVVAVEHQLRGDFVDMVLTAGTTEIPALNRRAVEMGYPLDRQHIVLLFNLSQNVSRLWSIVASEFRTSLLDSGVLVFLCTYEEKLVALCGHGDELLLKTMMIYASQTRDRIKLIIPDLQIAIGIGKPGEGLAGLRRSFTQANEVMDLIRTHFNDDKVLAFSDLGLHHLLHYLHDCDEFDGFYNQTLAPLVLYDDEHDARLVQSLESFFIHNGNISQTAEALHLHRNSLLYRMERINEITGMNINDVDDRFALQLALKIQPFLNTCE